MTMIIWNYDTLPAWICQVQTPQQPSSWTQILSLLLSGKPGHKCDDNLNLVTINMVIKYGKYFTWFGRRPKPTMSEGREIFLSLIGNEAHNLMPNQNWNINYLWRCSLFIVSSTCTNTNPTCPDVHSSCWVSSGWSEVHVPRCSRCFAGQGSGCPCWIR